MKKSLRTPVAALLGAVAGNLAHHMLRSYRQKQQVRRGELPDGEVVRAVWVPESTVVATILGSRVAEQPGAVGFLLAMALALVAAASAD